MHKPLLPLLMLLTANVLAADVSDGSEVELRRYTVEMIIFAYSERASGGNEVFVADQPPAKRMPSDDVTLEFSDRGGDPPVTAQPVTERSNAIPYELVMLAEKDFSLDTVYDHLRRLDAYKPLMHFGWTQATHPDQQAEMRPLGAFASPPGGLSGDLSLYLSRYLHLAVKLQLDAPSSRRDTFDLEAPVRYRIDEDRIFRNGELRYFDHPKFGVLAKVTRVEEPKPNDDELLGYSGE